MPLTAKQKFDNLTDALAGLLGKLFRKGSVWSLRFRWKKARRRFQGVKPAIFSFVDVIFWAALLLFLIIGAWSLFWFVWSDELGSLWPSVYVEFFGLIFDVVFIGLLFTLYSTIRGRQLEQRRQQEIIDDFKNWDAPEGHYRIAGAVRRLCRLGRTDIDFRGIHISNFSFPRNDIKSIEGAVFYDGSWGTRGSRDEVVLERVQFDGVNCRNVVFSKFNPFESTEIDITFARFVDCSFVDANLSNASFRGAHLHWPDTPPAELGVWHEWIDEPPAFEQTHWPPFHAANLDQASFENVRFLNADFRGSENILTCNFARVAGLETCVFDDDIEQRIRESFPEAFGREDESDG